MVLFLLVPAANAQDTSGFIDSVSNANAFNAYIEWRESWFTGLWYNFSFVDNFGFNYTFYGNNAPPPREEFESVNAFLPALGDFSTSYCGPKFILIGYIQEDDVWCLLPAVLSPQYILGALNQFGNERYIVNELWYCWNETWERNPPDPPTYQYETTYANHNLIIWGRLPPGKTVQVWWGADAFTGWETYRIDNLISARDIYIQPPDITVPPVHYETLAAYKASGSGLWRHIGDFNAGGTAPPPGEEPPGWAECSFDTMLKTDGSSGVNWLPEPGSQIGLKFKFKRTETPATALIRYNIYNISTWQGECMNFPVNAPEPAATGNGEHFDFAIVDTADYDVEICDYDLYNGVQVNFRPDNPTHTASVRRYVLTFEIDFAAGQTERYHTLWLKARDYGAKAIVSPTTGQTWRDLMRSRTTAFGQDAWSVSVPRDDDGPAFTGYNWGDFMADAWEESVLGLPSPSGDSSIVRFTPFYRKNDAGDIVYSDTESLPAGRNIDGDGVCNWEEYRGFITVGDQFGYYPPSSRYRHRRTNPMFKNVMVHFMPNAECKPDAPGWMDTLPDTMAYLVDHLTVLDDDTATRLSLRRRVNINKLGAHYPYYSSKTYDSYSFSTTNRPANGRISTDTTFQTDEAYQNAIVYWPIYRGNHPRLKPQQRDTFGYVKANVSFPPPANGATIPKYAFQVVIQTDNIDSYTANLPYYYGNLPDFLEDSAKLRKLCIAHESGHTIGMPHDSVFQYIMAKHPLTGDNNQHRLILDPPEFTKQYSGLSISNISILMEGR